MHVNIGSSFFSSLGWIKACVPFVRTNLQRLYSNHTDDELAFPLPMRVSGVQSMRV
jgi:hypothetical protein